MFVFGGVKLTWLQYPPVNVETVVAGCCRWDRGAALTVVVAVVVLTMRVLVNVVVVEVEVEVGKRDILHTPPRRRSSNLSCPLGHPRRPGQKVDSAAARIVVGEKKRKIIGRP